VTDQRLSPALQVKFSSVDSAGAFSGYASTFGGKPDSYGDVIAPGAFAKSLVEHKDANTAPALLWAHDPGEVIGRWLDIREDAKGLKVEGKLTMETQRGAEAHALMKDGALGLSIGFMVAPGGARYDDKKRLRTLTEIKLFEVSAVAMPANPAARITSVKSIREFEAAAQDALGLTPRQAKALAAGGYSALMRRDDRSEELGQLARDIVRWADELKSLLKGTTR
jgi:uncharacterized protein